MDSQSRSRWNKRLGRIAVSCAIALLLTLTICTTLPVSAVAASNPTLTLPTLEQRLSENNQAGKAPIIDLSGLTIDLRAPDLSAAQANRKSDSASSEQDFASQFYQRLQQKLNPKNPASSQAIGLDLSNSLILGDFELVRLSRRIPAYSTTVPPCLRSFQPSVSTAARQGATGQRAVRAKPLAHSDKTLS